MSRLIDVGLLLDHLSGRLESMKDYDAIKDVVNDMPTAYDVDKVVEAIEEKSERHGGEDYYIEVGDAIEIVKDGGVDA